MVKIEYLCLFLLNLSLHFMARFSALAPYNFFLLSMVRIAFALSSNSSQKYFLAIPGHTLAGSI